jgi:phage-related protein
MNSNIIITHPDGSTTLLNSGPRTSGITKAEQSVGLLAEDTVTITVKSATPLEFVLGDTIEVYGKTYTINQLPTVKKTGTRKFEYTLTFEGVQYELIDAQFLLPYNTIGDSFTGNLLDFLQIVIVNVLRVFPNKWVLGEYPQETEFKTLTFSGRNCLDVLQDLCKEYSQEFEITQNNGIRTLNIRKAGVAFPYTFRYGKTGGLYELTRQNINSKNVVTRLFIYGGSNNLGNTYRHSKLCLPGSIGKNDSYIESAAAIAAFGLKENTKVFDNIFPNRYGEVTGLGSKYYAFIDNTMNFDLNEKDGQGNTKWLIAGVSAKVKFTTGNLAGYEFDVHKYDSSTKEIQLVPFTDESGMKFPSETSAAFQFSPGDKYFFTDINLPDQYKTEAELELQEEGESYYLQNCQPQVQYGLNIDQNFIKQFAGQLTVVNLFAVGDYIPVKDEDLGVDKSIRITGFTRDLLQPYKYSLTLGDSVTKTTITRVISDLKEIDEVIRINNLADPSKARRSWRASQEVLAMVFDPEGDYYSDKIKPLSIETTMLQVGAKSMQFVLRNVVFEPNYQGNPNYIRITGGHLIHYTIEEVIRTWEIAQVSYSNLVSNTAYYIYARCSKTTGAGSIILDTTQRKVDNEATYYTFLIGVLNSVETDTGGKNPARLVSLTYGSSTIAGRFIKTGRIESSGGSTYFDLDNEEIGGNINFISSDGSSKNVSDLDSVAQETKDYINNTLPGILDEIQAQLDGQIEQFFETYDPTTSNAPANTWITTADKENHLGDLFYNTSTGKVFRWIKNGTVYSWQELQDSELAQALALANEALALAKNKNRIFTTTPVTPYEIGDLWVQGASGDIMRCKVTRLTGSYNSSDWEKASQYTSDAGLNNFINGSYASTINDLTNQIDGKIESWFQTSDPATAWTTAAVRAKHVGDMWYSSATKLLKRYTVSGSTYGWTTIEDQKAIDAYEAAGQAQDTADGKRRVFVSTPYPPYEIGDLWVNGIDLRRCSTARTTGSYVANDWVIAVNYDNTVTTINGGIVTSGTVQLAGSGGSILAGITGQGTTSSSVRVWAGASYENRGMAPFRVLQDGSFVANKATIEGNINAISGSIGGFEIESGQIGATASGTGTSGQGLSLYNDFIKFANAYCWASIGANVLPAFIGSVGVGRFYNETPNSYGTNYGLLISVKNAAYNFAISATGDIVCNGMITSYPFTAITPDTNKTHIPGEASPCIQKVIVRFVNSNSGLGLPSRLSIASRLHINPSASFAIRFTVICSADSTVRGHIWGRTTERTDMSSINYPQRLNNNAGVETGGLAMEKGDIEEFFLVWDGINYRAYHLNSRS